MDGIDAAIIRTDGHEYVQPIDFISTAYDDEFTHDLRRILGKTRPDDQSHRIERELTTRHARIVTEILSKHPAIARAENPVIGFHGHTVFHAPEKRFTWQIGDGKLLSRLTKLRVVNDLRSADVKAGGQGAPLLPLYHKILCTPMINKKIRYASVLNLGGVGNITFIDLETGKIMAFDTGPANALIDDFIHARTGEKFDKNGDIAAQGTPDQGLVENWMTHDYFSCPPPKSLDRSGWDTQKVQDLSTENGAATLAEFTVHSVISSLKHIPATPQIMLVCGGGRKNKYIMNALADAAPCPVKPIEHIGHNGDAIEAEGFALLAVRHILGLPVTYPDITGAPRPLCGGTLYTP